MTDPHIVHRMRVALDANAAAYRRAVQTSAPGDCWDFVVLTAANEKQAEGYRQELALRHRAVGPTGAFFPAIQKSVVVPDPPGRRAGSGGATLGVMRALVEQFDVGLDTLLRRRILLIHSGGASQRLPAYSPVGKIFAPLPLLRPDGQISTLFDHLYITLAGLPERLGPGMLVVAGDVFLLMDHRQVSAPAAGVTALTMRVDAELGLGHGVFVTDGRRRITRTLQKVSVDVMRQAGATDDRAQVLIDSGLLFFDSRQTQVMAELAGAGGRSQGLLRHKAQIDLYEDMTGALAGATSKAAYLTSGHRAIRKALWDRFHGTAFQAMQLEGQFLHLGTTRQFRDAMVGLNPSPAAELFQQNLLAETDAPIPADSRIYHSAVRGSIGHSTVIEHSLLASARIGDGCIVSQAFSAKTLRLPADTLLFQVPLRDKGELRYAQVICGVHDDFKGSFSQRKCSFFNAPIGEWFARHGIKPKEVWGGIADDQRTLWNARLFPGDPHRDRAHQATWMAANVKAAPNVLKRWRSTPRYSMAMLLEQVDPAALIEHRETVAAHLQAGQVLGALEEGHDRPVESLFAHYASASGYRTAIDRLGVYAKETPTSPVVALRQARALWTTAQLLQRSDCPPSAELLDWIDANMRLAFAKVADASELASPEIEVASRRGIRIQPGLRIEAASPVRLDLSGGWSDTPPYCYERGGHVINVAINLDGHPPVRAIVRAVRQPVLILESQDLGRHVEIRGSGQLRQGVDVHDPFALHKVALEMADLLPTGDSDLSAHLRRLGGGLIVSTESRVPKGSGLGTSSILAATLLGALHEAAGQPASHDELIRQTLLLEQRLGTGGGWQDQVGGIVGGVKSTVTLPGLPQQPVVERLSLTDAQVDALQEQLVVYYSGQQRLARDILRRVMGRWLAREPAVIHVLEQLKASAAALRTSLLKGQWPAAARHVARYWEIKKQLYPGSTTPGIDILFLELRDLYSAAGLAGAGGGGFAYFLCRNGRQAARLREGLASQAGLPGAMGTVFQSQINRAGLTISRSTSPV